ncbi:MAG: AAA family ATPase [Thermodesulfobacteriota bacterium]|nr:AAA family ATPase [Thermodesulfobacteriota bacterium]
MIIGMKHPVADYVATAMAEIFYRHLTLKCTAGQALQEARRNFKERYKGRFQWAIPALFSQDGDTSIIDWTEDMTPIEPRREPSTILYGKVKHLKEGFVGRRREVRECMKILRQGTPPAICITGAGGTGKSTLASRLTDRLHRSGFMVVPIYGEVTPDSFIQHTINSLVGEKESERISTLKELTDYNDRITYIISNIIGTKETVFLFDNFEDNLKQSARFQEFKNTYWEEPFKRLLDQLPHTGSRALITCRYTIPNLSGELLLQTPLKEMIEAETKKLIVFNEDYAGIGLDRINEIYETIGGNPKAIKDLGKVIAEQGNWDNIKAGLEKVSRQMREFTIFKELYNFLSEQEKQFFRKISVYHGPIEIDAITYQEPDTKKAKENIQRLIDYGLLQWYEDHIYSKEYYEVHPLNRGHIEEAWQTKGEMETEEMEAAHQRAAQYYLGFTGRGLDLDKLTRAVLHLGAGKE